MKRIIVALTCVWFSQINFAETPACVEKNNFCNLIQLKSDPALLKQFKFSDDPAGIDAQALGNLLEAEQALQNYANTHHCELYTLSFFDLIQGLFKGSMADMQQENSKSEAKQNEKKFFIIEGDKGVCIKKLGMKLPIKLVKPLNTNA